MAPLNEQTNPRRLAEQAQQLYTYFNAFAADGMTWDLIGDLPEIQQNEHDLGKLKQSIMAQWRLLWVSEGIKAALRLLPAAHAVAATEAIILSLKGEHPPARLTADAAVAQATQQASRDQLSQTLTTLVAADTENTTKLGAAFLKEYEILNKPDLTWLDLLRRFAAPVGVSTLALIAITIAATAGWRFFGDDSLRERPLPPVIAKHSTPTPEPQVTASETAAPATETVATEPSATDSETTVPASPSATAETTTPSPSPTAAPVEALLTPLEVVFVEAEQKYEPSQFTLRLNRPLNQRVTLRDTSGTINLSLVQPTPAPSTAAATAPSAPPAPDLAPPSPSPSPSPGPSPSTSSSPDLAPPSPTPEIVVTLALDQPPPISGPVDLTLYLGDQQTTVKVRGVVRRAVKGATSQHSDQTAPDYYKDKLLGLDKWAAHVWKAPEAPDTIPTAKLPDNGKRFTLLVDGDVVDILEDHGDYYVVRIVDSFDKANDPDIIGRTGWIKKIYING